MSEAYKDRMRVEEHSWKQILFSFFVMPFIIGLIVVAITMPLLLFGEYFFNTEFGMTIKDSFNEVFVGDDSDEMSEPCFPISYEC